RDGVHERGIAALSAHIWFSWRALVDYPYRIYIAPQSFLCQALPKRIFFRKSTHFMRKTKSFGGSRLQRRSATRGLGLAISASLPYTLAGFSRGIFRGRSATWCAASSRRGGPERRAG